MKLPADTQEKLLRAMDLVTAAIEELPRMEKCFGDCSLRRQQLEQIHQQLCTILDEYCPELSQASNA